MRRKESPCPTRIAGGDVDIVERLDMVGGEADRDLDDGFETGRATAAIFSSTVGVIHGSAAFPGCSASRAHGSGCRRGGDQRRGLFDLLAVRFACVLQRQAVAEKR